MNLLNQRPRPENSQRVQIGDIVQGEKILYQNHPRTVTAINRLGENVKIQLDDAHNIQLEHGSIVTRLFNGWARG